MIGKFCFVCGKKTDDLTKGKCKDCYYKGVSLVDVPKNITVTICPKCNAIKVKRKWKRLELENYILDHIKINEKDVQLELNERGTNYELIATNGKTEKHKIIMKLEKQVCEICARKYTQYYDAVLQIRGNYDDKIMDYIESRLFIMSKRDKKAFYTYHKVKEGINIRLGSKSAAWRCAEIMKKKYGARLKRSYKLIGKKKGKELYRDFVSVRF